jgi:uncharacterized protein YebE (UPF0316 family)
MEVFEMDFLKDAGAWIYVVIFFGKILEVTVSTLRVVLINRGERLKGSFIALFDIIIWLFITGTVLEGFKEDPLRMLVFAFAFAIGNYLGSWLEDKLAFGLSSVQVIVPESDASRILAESLRNHHFAVTMLKGTGKDGNREILLLHLKRKRIAEAVELVNSEFKEAVIVVSDSKVVSGGYIAKK